MNQPTKLNPCKCGSTDITVWHHIEYDRTSIEKIECNDCGRVVWGSDEDGIKDWNNQEYCDEPN